MKKTILITGSSTGIGRSTVLKFQQEGWNVIATMRTPEKETELNALDNVLVTRLDVQDYDSIEKAIGSGIEKFGKIDVVLNNAGYGLMGTFESINRDSIQRQYDVNVFGLMDVTRAMLPHFRANKAGMFINVSSIGGKMTFPLISVYHSTKFAVEGFSESLHYELASTGIEVKIIEPGAIATDFGSRSMDFQHDENLTDYNEAVGAFSKAMESLGNPENQSKPGLVADVIYGAATDGTSKMRYRAGADAEQFLDARNSMDDEAFFGMIRQNLGM